MNFNFGIDGDLIANHPLNVFTKLYSEDTNNKVYKECLENEIQTAIDELTKHIDNDTLMFLKKMLDEIDLTEQELEYISDDNLRHEYQTHIYVTKKIISGVYNNKKTDV